MANGGIPVAGGTTNFGTLIHTNLLYAPLLRDAYGNAVERPAWTLGGTAGAAGYGAAFIRDKDPLTLYKTAPDAGEQTLTMVLSSTTRPAVYGVVLVGHNMTSTNITSAKFEGGDGNYTDVTEDLVINAATLTPAYVLLSAAATGKDRWRIRVTYAAATEFQIGEVFLIGAAPLAFARNYSWQGGIDDLEIGKMSSSGINGVPRTVALWERLRKEFLFERISETQKTALQQAARNGSSVFSPDGASGFAHFGVFELEPPAPVMVDQFNVRARFTEAAR